MCDTGIGEMEVIKDTDLIKIPEEMCIRIDANTKKSPNGEKDLMKLIANHVYPNLSKNSGKLGWMDGRAILALIK